MLAKERNIIRVATEEELRSTSYYHRLWIAVRNMEIRRRDWLDAIADAIRDYDGEIVDELGQPYPLPEIDDVFTDDFDMRWFGYYLKALRRHRIFKLAYKNMIKRPTFFSQDFYRNIIETLDVICITHASPIVISNSIHSYTGLIQMSAHLRVGLSLSV